MRRLILLRHAKSNWDDPTQSDFDRPLNARGKRSAEAIGTWLAAHDYVPAEVLCSSALRARETWDRLAPAFKDPPKPRFLEALYLADPEETLDCLAQADAAGVMVIGHNPGFAELAARLVSPAPAHPKFAQFPTAATLVCDFEVEGWAALRPGSGRVVDFIIPRDLIDEDQ
ncbi:MAG: histidine phosphatase family protein [Pseudomonadota bacterium]